VWAAVAAAVSLRSGAARLQLAAGGRVAATGFARPVADSGSLTGGSCELAARRSAAAADGGRTVRRSVERRQQAVYTMVLEPEAWWGHVLVVLREPHLLEHQDLAHRLHLGLPAAAR